jgi:peptide/nickel transport system substrate-binding protein
MNTIFATALTAALTLPPMASRAADLRMALSSSPSAMDPQFHNLGANLNVAQNMFDTLVRIDADSHLAPGLAVGWDLVNDHTWEFHPRPGVTFHSGAKLNADDVVFSLGQLAASFKPVP